MDLLNSLNAFSFLGLSRCPMSAASRQPNVGQGLTDKILLRVNESRMQVKWFERSSYADNVWPVSKKPENC
jgi:hypothetical protein